MNNYYVYKHTCPNGKVYIGITKNRPSVRWGKNGNGYKNHHAHFYSAIQKYGWDNISHEILFDGLTKEEACQKEIELISEYKSNEPQYGYNIVRGGETGGGMLGKIHSSETRKKMREAKKDFSPTWLKGKKLSEEHKLKCSQALKGRKLSEETKEKIRQSKLNMSDEYRRKLSEANKNRKHDSPSEKTKELLQEHCPNKKTVFQYTLTGEKINTWKSMKQIQRELGYCSANIGKCCNGRAKSAYGYVWKFESEVI